MTDSGVGDVDMCASPFKLLPTLDASIQDVGGLYESVDNIKVN
jgi:hypothetical protein